MRIEAVTLEDSQQYPGEPGQFANDRPLKTFRSGEAFEVYLEPSGLVVVMKKGASRALAFHISSVERLEMTMDTAIALVSDKPTKRG